MEIKPRQSINLVGDLAIIQGGTWSKLAFVVNGDQRAGTARGQIRDALREDGGQLIAEFTFAPALYDALEGSTTFFPTLSPQQTSAMPSTRYQGQGTLSDKTAYLFDLEISTANGTLKTFPGFVQVIGEVTD